MTKFDYIVLALLVISALVGFARGAVREVVALLALIVGGAAALFGLPQALPVVARVVHTPWMATAIALAVLFLAAYIVMRLIGAVLVRRLRGSNVLGALDRTVGLMIGLARGFVFLGALHLMFIAATPEDLRPKWIVEAHTWPLARDMGRMLMKLAPKGADAAGQFRPSFERLVREPSRDRSATAEYDARRGGEADDLVEKSR